MPSLFSILACLGRRFAATIFLFSVFGRPVMLLHIRHFNSCSLREERSTWYLYKMNVATFQFSLPREERCCIPKVVHGLLAISILAPAWGATYFQFTAHYCHHISILVPCVGSDKSAMLHRRSFAVFNSRSPHGERSRLLSLFRTALFFQFSLPA